MQHGLARRTAGRLGCGGGPPTGSGVRGAGRGRVHAGRWGAAASAGGRGMTMRTHEQTPEQRAWSSEERVALPRRLRKARMTVAVHEAGHAVAQLYLGG